MNYQSSRSARPNSAFQRGAANNPIRPKSTINPLRREKLKSLLFDKYKKKFGKFCTQDLIKAEVNLFMGKEHLTEKELKELDKKIENGFNFKIY